MKATHLLIGIAACAAMPLSASATTWEKCFASQDEAYELVSKLNNFAQTRVALKPVENEVFKDSSLDLNDLEQLFGEPESIKPIGSVGDRIFEWVPLITREFSATDVSDTNGTYCTYVSARAVHHQLRATVDIR